MKKNCLQRLPGNMELNGSRKGHMRNILMFIILRRKSVKKEVQALEREKEYLTAENEGLTAQIAEARADIQLFKR